MIPAQAVEAAAKALADVDPLWPDGAWETMHDELREQALGMARVALEAAAPHLLAVVISTRLELEALWLGSVVLSEGVSYQRYGSDEWYGEGCPYGSREIKLPAIVLHNPNPYRPTS